LSIPSTLFMIMNALSSAYIDIWGNFCSIQISLSSPYLKSMREYWF